MHAVIDVSIHAVFKQRVAQHAHAIALIDGERQFSYATLDRLADAQATRLRADGVGPGDIVALFMRRSAEMFVALLGILKAGAAFMPLDAGNPATRNRFCLDKARTRLIVTDRDCEELLSETRRAVRVDLDAPAPAEVAEPYAGNGEDTAYVMFTSGTTSEPKGVLVPHRAVTRLVLDTDYVRIEPSDAILQLSTPSFDASTFEIFGALLNGATLVLYTGEVLDPNLFKQHVERHRISVLWLTAALFHLFVDKYLEALRPLRVLLAGGDVLHPGAVRRVLDEIDGITLINGYGPTENTTFTCCHVMTRANAPHGDKVPIGRPIRGTEVLILDEQRRPTLPGEVGELYAAGRGVALGYLGSEGVEGAFFHDSALAAGRLYRTGDLVRCNADGLIEFLGRRDSQIKLRGYRISLEEIKARLMQMPAIKEAAVTCQELENGDQLLVAYVRADESDGLQSKTVRKYLAEHLPRYMIPDKISIQSEIPINQSGKIDRNKLFSNTHAFGGRV
ncbi:MAG: amino acid adenylation domain-containing protein [Rhodanobacteraceae bacterium]|nr:amino acid adenylation domain-containing protein [Rhodanobacteraceae bacterium]